MPETNWHQGEIELWMANDYGAYLTVGRLRSVDELREYVTEFVQDVPNCAVDLDKIDWDDLFRFVNEELYEDED